MTTRPTLAVVSITRNDLSGLQRTVASVRAQSVAPDEYLVIDGDSTDGTKAWLAPIRNTDQFFWFSEADSGIYDAMNKGIEKTSADYVLFLNSGDEFIHKDTICESHRFLAARPSWAYGRSRIGVQGADFVHDLGPLRKLRFFLGIGTIPHQATFISRTLLRSIGAFDLRAGISADQEMLLRAWKQTSPTYMPLEIARCDATGVSSNQPIGTWSRQMANHRASNEIPVLGSPGINGLIMRMGIQFESMRAVINGARSRVRQRSHEAA